jgi:hypothetical protein
MKPRREIDPQQMEPCVYTIPCECGRSYIGETGRSLAVLLRERRSVSKTVLQKNQK